MSDERADTKESRVGERLDALRSVELTFGECEGLCGRMVTFAGWDRYCSECEAEMREEDRERNERLNEEDEYFYGV